MTYKIISSEQIPKRLCSPILVDINGVPYYWAYIWSFLTLESLELSTKIQKLRYVNSLYEFAEKLHKNGYLDSILATCDISKIGSLLEAYFVMIKNKPEITAAAEKKWQTCYSFIKDIIYFLSKNNSSDVSLSEIEARLFYIDRLYGQLRIQKSRGVDNLRSLPISVVTEIHEMISPGATNNPFGRTIAMWNAYIVFTSMLYWGLRCGEALLLPVNTVKFEFDTKSAKTRYWINIRKNEYHQTIDSRFNKPGIKNSFSIRKIPISEMKVNLIQAYVENHRGKPNHPFLLNSQWNKPLSQESIKYYFKILNGALTPDAKSALYNQNNKISITPHDLRHTCAVIRLNQFLGQGCSMDEALEKMRIFFGWSRDSDMPRKYGKAVFSDRISDIWSNIFDDRIEVLRHLSSE